ncbi:MAG: hypothetical protein A2493_02520 [Candidatus Magasanikbacteria bacterium RIFOXYC12_FULL_33_11]|uniref:Uncharacterized protein n=1 Tax=Candidatus Magasanikbacteria bacterium RIFOXYC12_FULL_33_11 TaxID=1798701 RepID=A0A1F6NQ79_9BACT|nr:MAG: hypothetical protein A2493_02520 [Candidatus Magasanikbacteria bacterium RIFOXYC12_FULL_33_11]
MGIEFGPKPDFVVTPDTNNKQSKEDLRIQLEALKARIKNGDTKTARQELEQILAKFIKNSKQQNEKFSDEDPNIENSPLVFEVNTMLADLRNKEQDQKDEEELEKKLEKLLKTMKATDNTEE